jgi:hypothetical protein
MGKMGWFRSRRTYCLNCGLLNIFYTNNLYNANVDKNESEVS